MSKTKTAPGNSSPVNILAKAPLQIRTYQAMVRLALHEDSAVTFFPAARFTFSPPTR
jgi:hypothetical protein